MNRRSFITTISGLAASSIFMSGKNILETLGSGATTARMPVLFIGHGSPMNAIEENVFVEGFRNAAEQLPKPKAILCISAHWETNGTFVTAMEKPRTIHDFGGFPEALFQVQYPAPGSPWLAAEVQNAVQKTTVQPDLHWGLDHGTWSVLKHFYPKADVPIVQLSIDRTKPAEWHYALAKQLAVLRNKGVLIIGSGNIIHNLRLVAWHKLDEPEYGFDWALSARETINEAINSGNHQKLINYKKLGKEVQLAVPTPEHYLPLLYVLALQDKNEQPLLFNDKAIGGSLSMTSVKIG